MKKITTFLYALFLFGLLCFSSVINAQNTFRINYDIANFDLAGGVIQIPTGNYLFAGTNANFIPLYGNLFELDQAGNIVWAKGYAASLATEFSEIKNISTGGYIIAGSSDPGEMLMKIAPGGIVTWANKYATTNGTNERAERVIETSDGGFITAGSVESYDPTGPPTILDSANIYIVKTNSTGTILWDKIIFVTTAFDNEHYIRDVAEVSDGYIFVGSTSEGGGSNESTDAIILKTNLTGTLQWIKKFGVAGKTEGLFSAKTLSNGEVLVSGSYNNDMLMMRINSAGTVTWGYTYSSGSFFFPNTAESYNSFETVDGKYASLGTYIDFGAFPNFTIASFLVKIEPSNGSLIFQRSYNGGLSSITPEGIQVSDSGYVIAMMAQQFTGFNYHLIKTDPTGNLLDAACTPSNISLNKSSFTPSFVNITPNIYSGSTKTSFVPVIANLTPTKIVDCQTIVCTPPPNPTASATSTTICSGSSTTINASGSGSGVVYNVYTTATGGTSLGATPLVVSPTNTTTYYVEAIVTATSCTSTARDSVTITVVPVVTSNAGANQTICASSTTLAGNTPTSGTGIWTLLSGSGTITTPSSPTSGVTGLGVGANTFVWTISNAPCTPSTSQVIITVIAPPTISNAGANQTICSSSTILAGNTPTIGTGTWTLISGSGTITNPSSPTSGVTGLGVGANVFQWAITNSPCTSSTSQVTITNTGGPTASNAGANQTICSSSTTLAGNTPTIGTGTWTLLSGSGTITNPSSPTSGVTGLGVGANTFVWTISNAPCTPSTSQVIITVIAPPTISNAGANQTICSSSTTLAGNTPTIGTGTWTLISGSGTITNSSSPTSGVTGLGVGANVFQWAITNSPCTSSTSQVTITVNPIPTVTASATPLNTICNGDTITLTGGGATTYTWDNGVTDGVPFVPTGNLTYTVTGTAGGCSNTAQITVTVNPLPTIITAAAPDTIICVGDTVALTGSGGISYTWDNNVVDGVAFSPTATATYTVIGIDANGCKNTAQVSINVVSLPIVTANVSPQATICSGDTIILLGGGATTYTWDNGVTDGVPFVPTTTIIYTVTGTVGANCSNTDTITVFVNPLPTINASSTDTVICQGDQITLSGLGGSSYTWDNGVTDGVIFTPTATTTYTITGTDVNTCQNTAQLTITVNPLPTINITGNNILCIGDSTTLTASGGVSYVWSTTAITAAINVNPTTITTYNVTGTDTNGCNNTKQITITVQSPPTAVIIGNNNMCLGNTINLTASGGNTYVWSTSDTSSTINISPTDTTIYTVIASIGSCTDTTTITINVVPTPTISLNPSPDTTIILGQSVDLNVAGGSSFNWNPNGDLSCSTCANPTATPTATTTYCVLVLDNGCSDTACVTVNVDIVCGEVYVPTAFSPNGDGQNDCLKVYNNCIESMSFKVYARWGEVVFESTNVDDCWDGSYKGKSLNNAVFVYTLNATLITGEKIALKGNVSLIR